MRALGHAPAGLHAGLVERISRPRRVSAEIVTLRSLAVPAAPDARSVQGPRRALTVRVEPGLRAALLAEKARLATTQQAILHRALTAWLGRRVGP